MIKIIETLKNKTVIVTGASRGLGKAISIKLAREGANVIMLARSKDIPSHNELEGTLEDVAHEISSFGGKAYPLKVDIRDVFETQKSMSKIINDMGSIDVLINNASAINLSKTMSVTNYNLLMDVNVRGCAHMIMSSYDHLIQSDIGHILTISPPLSTLTQKWLHPHPVYSTSKYAMTMLTLGYSDILRANTIWPKKLIATASTKMLEKKMNIPAYSKGLSATQFANTVYKIICSDISGMSCLDDDIIPVEKHGIEDIFTTHT